MLYRFSHDRYNNFKYFKENTLNSRSYFIPFVNRDDCDKTTYIDERYNSSLVTVLSGEWGFKYYPKLTQLPLEMDTFFENFDSVYVPSCWQFTGYEKPFYVNQKYQFDCHPPYVPADTAIMGKNTKLDNGMSTIEVSNSLGLYRKTFKMKRTQKQVLTFFGASSNIQVYLNGRYVGYSEGSHNTSEFDISGYVCDGENELIVLVYKWCNGSYLEAQDMFRNNGIFRDVIVTSYGKNYIYDYSYNTLKKENDYSLKVKAECALDKGASLKCSLYREGKLVEEQSGKEEFEFKIQKPDLWSAEIPNLYIMYLEIVKNGKVLFCVRQEVGFKDIEINGNIFKFNDKKIKLLGVNHHDSHSEKGYAMSLADLEKDIKLMKEYNVNTVRTSHYPPDPAFLKMANYYGIYVVDEADIETHGVCSKKVYQINLISNNRKWKEHYWDRVYRMFMRDRNNVCVVMWSLGNEAGGIKCQDYCYANLKKLTNIPVHYEGAIRTRRVGYDVVSSMYPSVHLLRKIAKGEAGAKYLEKPYFLCEYAHAMGVGPGGLNGYTDAFFSSDITIGGCIWEWCDHAVLHSDGTYTYGGDHEEWVHDGNFCVDGLFFPDRTPHTGALAMKNEYRPVVAKYVSNNKYSLFNRRYFADTKDITIKWQYTLNGLVDCEGVLDQVIPPRGEVEVNIKHPVIDTTKICAINFFYFTKDGREIAKEQIELCAFIDNSREISCGGVAFIEEQNLVNIVTDAGRVVFNKTNGNLVSYNVGGVEFLSKVVGLQPNIYTAAIDNYMYIDKTWKKQGFENVEKQFLSIEGDKQKDKVVVTVDNTLKLLGEARFEFRVIYTIYPDCSMDIKVAYDSRKVYDMPRYGIVFTMDGRYNKVKYYGMGESESYSDLKSSAIMGVYEFSRDNMTVDYIKPQENGNRSNVIWADVSDENGNALRFGAIEKPLNFKVTDYTLDALRRAKHIQELVKCNESVVYVDGFVRGLGANSCGQDTEKECRQYSGNKFEYSFSVKPTVFAKVKK